VITISLERENNAAELMGKCSMCPTCEQTTKVTSHLDYRSTVAVTTCSC